MSTILVTGGAGFIGSHMVKMLGQRGHDVVVLDSLENGFADAVVSGTLIKGNIGDADLVAKIFNEHKPDAIMHFASYIMVGESMEKPEKYFENNVERTKVLIAEATKHKTPFIFSSTAATYGDPEYAPIDEKHPLKPINPYGESKRQCEVLLEEAHQKHGLSYGILRYFNAAGSDPEGQLGERHEPETHLIPLILQAVKGIRDKIYVFGDDYDTKDGTCIRDYIHVWDLCDAHIRLLDYINDAPTQRIFNVGTGEGFSVREVIEEVAKVTKQDVPWEMAERRAGDPAVLVADGTNIREKLGWKPTRSDLPTLISDVWKFMER